MNANGFIVAAMIGGVMVAAWTSTGPSAKSSAAASPSQAPIMMRISEQESWGCVYRSPTPTSPLRMCIDTTQEWCDRWVGGFVFGTYYEGEKCSDLKARDAY